MGNIREYSAYLLLSSRQEEILAFISHLLFVTPQMHWGEQKWHLSREWKLLTFSAQGRTRWICASFNLKILLDFFSFFPFSGTVNTLTALQLCSWKISRRCETVLCHLTINSYSREVKRPLDTSYHTYPLSFLCLQHTLPPIPLSPSVL